MKHQCLLEKVDKSSTMVAWIEISGDFSGCVELVEDGKSLGLYKVKEIYQPGIPDNKLKEKQSYDRKGFPSLQNN